MCQKQESKAYVIYIFTTSSLQFASHVGGALLIGIVSLLAGLILLFLPETRATKLPQTIPDAEAMTGWVLFSIKFPLKTELP